MSNYLTINPVELQEMLTGAIVLIDVRSHNEVERGRIAGALHIPLQDLPANVEQIAQDRPVVFYCQSGARSALASQFLAGNGRAQVYNLAGGIGAWMAHGFPVVRDAW